MDNLLVASSCCPIGCGVEVVFLRGETGRVFCFCDSCGCAWGTPDEAQFEAGVNEVKTIATFARNVTIASLSDLAKAGLTDSVLGTIGPDQWSVSLDEINASLSSGSAAVTARVSLVVLRCADLDATRDFYAALGLRLIPEQHAMGPRHYSSTCDGVVLEFYPLEGRPTSGLRLGLALSAALFSQERASQAGGTLVRDSESPSGGRRVILRDPDGHTLDIQVEH